MIKSPSQCDGRPIGRPMQSVIVNPSNKGSRKRAEAKLGLTFNRPKRVKKKGPSEAECVMYMALIMLAVRGFESEPEIAELLSKAQTIGSNSQLPWNKAARLRKLVRVVKLLVKNRPPSTKTGTNHGQFGTPRLCRVPRRGL